MKVRKLVLKVLKSAGGAPRTVVEVARELSEKRVTSEQVESEMTALAAAGNIVETKPGAWTLRRDKGVYTGRVSVTRNGYGFVNTPAGDVYVAASELGTAMHGDIVEVRVFSGTRRAPAGGPGGRAPAGRGRGGLGAGAGGRAGSGGRSAGEIIAVVERTNRTIVGRFEKQGAVALITPTDRRIRGDVMVDRGAFLEAKTGDIVVVRITRYPTPGRVAQGEVEEVLGLPDAPGVDVEIVIREHGLRTEFPREVEDAAHAIPEAVGAQLDAGRQDLRELFTITIDPVDARDFDDAISLEREEGGFRLWVHIADVSHYVPWATVIDEEARERATSVYLVDRVLPMLPERLSNGVCSLNPGVDRLTVTVEMKLDRTGLVESAHFYPSAIRSDRRLDYDSVDRWLDTGREFPDATTEALLKDFSAMATALGKRRIARGGLDFESAEPKVWLDAQGRPVNVTLRERSVATNMIEEAMIAANEAVARHMRDTDSPMVYRIHEDPEPDALDQIAVILSEFDYPMKDIGEADPRTFQKIVEYAHSRPERLLINSLLLRALKRARYVDYLDSHFGLASEAYCHFTSPIRRYPDLIVHRLLKAQLSKTLDKAPTSDMVPELEWLAEHSSVMEREAQSAEDQSVRVKLCELMADHIGETFAGIISSVSTFGAFVQLDNTAEGLVHVTAMKDDYYSFDADRFLLSGEKSGAVWRLGQEVEVLITDVVVSDRRIEMEWA